MPGEGHRLSLRIGPGLGTLAIVRDRVREHLQAHRVDETASYAVDLALEELAGNTLRYGYAGDEPRSVHAEILVTRAEVALVLTDNAQPFDPTRHPNPEAPRSLGDAPVGGRGIAMVRRMVGAMRYQRIDGQNRLEVDVPRSKSPT
jgi:serine/threonine-protein kinase RsbW